MLNLNVLEKLLTVPTLPTGGPIYSNLGTFTPTQWGRTLLRNVKRQR
jgi:hypothetical protein